MKNTPAQAVYLEEAVIATGEKRLKDSSVIAIDGKFSIKAKVSAEGVYNLRLQNDPSPFASLINDASRITVDADFSKSTDFYNVTGSDASKAIQDYMAKLSETQREKFNYLAKADSVKNGGGDPALAASYTNQAQGIAEEMKAFSSKKIQESKNSSLALFTLATYQSMAQNPYYRINGYTEEELIGLLNDMVAKFPTRTDIAGIRNGVEGNAAKKLWVGKEAPEISLPDTEGKTVSLSSYRGKYVLVDFWASWCGPCRMENPNVVEAFHRFKNKNFTVLGVSLDFKKENWQRAIADDKLSWTHISDLKRWESVVVPVYKIQGIPFNVLVDPDGKVIAENLRGSFLQQKLEQVLN